MQKKIESLHELLTNEEDARACKGIPDRACQEVPGNFLKMLIAQVLTKIGDALLNPKVVLPWLFQTLGAPLYLIGFLVPIRESGSMLPQIILASYVRRIPVRKVAWVLGSVLQGTSVAAIALVAIFLEGVPAGWSIVLLLVVFSLSRGLCSIANKDVTGKVIPKHQRGQLNGWASSLSGLVTLISAGLLFWFSDTQSLSTALVLLTLASLSWFIAALAFQAISETPGETSGGENGWSVALSNLTVVKQDSDFRRFVLARALLLCSALSAPYLVILAASDALATLAFFMAASGLASFISGPFWGRLADLSSRQTMIFAGAGASVICLAVVSIALLAPQALQHVLALPVLYLLLTISHQGVRVGRKTYLTNMAEGDQRTVYVSVCNSIIGAVLLFVGFLTALISLWGAQWVLLVLAMLGGAGVILSAQLPEVE